MIGYVAAEREQNMNRRGLVTAYIVTLPSRSYEQMVGSNESILKRLTNLHLILNWIVKLHHQPVDAAGNLLDLATDSAGTRKTFVEPFTLGLESHSLSGMCTNVHDDA
jgi:hypothetical protein